MAVREYMERVTRLVNDAASGVSMRMTVEEYVLRNGHLFASGEISPEDMTALDMTGWPDHQPRECYRNAQMTAMTLQVTLGDRVKYVEGYMLANTVLPIAHAWVSIDGKVVDTTIRHPDREGDRIFGEIPRGREYYGVEMDPRPVTEHVVWHRTHISILDDWQCKWPKLSLEEPETR